MLSDNDHSGVLVVIGGVIALVFAGIGLSIFKDRHLGTTGNDALERQIREGADELARMKETLVLQSSHLDKLEQRTTGAVGTMTGVQARLGEQAALLKTLPATRDGLRRDVPTLEKEFAS